MTSYDKKGELFYLEANAKDIFFPFVSVKLEEEREKVQVGEV